MSQLKDEMITYITREEIEKIVTQIAAEISHEYRGKSELILVCPLKGSLLFCADLVRKLTLPIKIDFVKLISPKNEAVRFIKDLSEDITHKDVLIIEEIIDAGRTLNFLKDRLLLSNPKSVKIAALFDKPARREIPLSPDFVGMTLDDRYVVGYGMDSEELGRNYPDVFNFRQ